MLSLNKRHGILDIIIVNMRRSTFAAMCKDSVVWVGAVAEVRGWRVSARGTIATLLYYNSVDPSLVSVTDASLYRQQQQQRIQDNNSGYSTGRHRRGVGSRHEE